MAKGSDRLFDALQRSVAQTGANVSVKRVGCVGMCHRTPMIEVVQPGKSKAVYAGLGETQARDLVLSHFRAQGLGHKLSRLWSRAVDALLLDETPDRVAKARLDIQEPAVGAFLQRQVHIATEGFGEMDPLDLDEYVARGGFAALARSLAVRLPPKAEGPRQAVIPNQRAGEMPELPARLTPEQLIELVEASGLRGRGGAGFATSTKWRLARQQAAE